jgi:hypothetical protein
MASVSISISPTRGAGEFYCDTSAEMEWQTDMASEHNNEAVAATPDEPA